MSSSRIARAVKFELLQKVEPLSLDLAAPFMLDSKRKKSRREALDIAQKLVPRMELRAWSRPMNDIFSSEVVSSDEKWAFLKHQKIKTPIPMAEIRELFHRPSVHVALQEALAKLTTGATWNDCQVIDSHEVRESLYYGPSAYQLEYHSFLTKLVERAKQEGYRDMEYTEVLESFARPIFDEVTRKLEGEGKLESYPAEEIAENGKRLMEKAVENLKPEEAVLLKKHRIDALENVLQLYVRYSNGVNFGPIADALQLCTSWFLERRYSHFFSGIRVLSAWTKVSPSAALLAKLKNARAMAMEGPVFAALEKLPTASYSHGSFRGKTPCLTSAATKGDSSCVSSVIELEAGRKGKSEFAMHSSLEEIISAYIQELIALDTKLEEYVRSKTGKES